MHALDIDLMHKFIFRVETMEITWKTEKRKIA